MMVVTGNAYIFNRYFTPESCAKILFTLLCRALNTMYFIKNYSFSQSKRMTSMNAHIKFLILSLAKDWHSCLWHFSASGGSMTIAHIHRS